jgi:hypothetical protein
MKTRDRILECALQLFNQKGEPNVSTMELPTKWGSAPATSTTTSTARSRWFSACSSASRMSWRRCSTRRRTCAGAEDYWLFLHLIVERLAHYRFLFQDLSNLAGRLPKLAKASATCSMRSSARWRRCWRD